MKKRKRRLSHITNHEKQQARTSVDDASDRCLREFSGNDAMKRGCFYGTQFVEQNLRKKGFGLGKARR